jgi:hypothetical protein
MRGARPANGGRPADACQKLDTLGAYERTKTSTRPILVRCGQGPSFAGTPLNPFTTCRSRRVRRISSFPFTKNDPMLL